jgi:predicted nucleic acid-binding protein
MDSDDHKRSIAQNLLLIQPFINAQVLAEVANVCRRKFKYSKEDTLNLWTDLMADCNFIPTTKATVQYSVELAKRYTFKSLIL